MSSSVERLRECLNKHIKVELDDGRVVFGRLRCSDQANNIVVGDACELRVATDVGDVRRDVVFRTNLVLIPAHHIRRFCVDHAHNGALDITAPPQP
jgi:small nuclear ribonucleoprotein (snRNP)-like protein